MTQAQGAVFEKAELLNHTNGSIQDLKLKLEALEKMLSEGKAREEALTKSLEMERKLRKNYAANHEDFVKGGNLWVTRLVDVANSTTEKLANMGMSDVRYTPEPNVSPNARLTLFFEGVLGALE